LKTIHDRLRTAEKKLEQRPPFDLVGRMYPTLSPEEKRRYWFYWYGGQYSTQTAELIEENFVSGTLNFECDIKPTDKPFPELDAWEAAIKRLPV